MSLVLKDGYVDNDYQLIGDCIREDHELAEKHGGGSFLDYIKKYKKPIAGATALAATVGALIGLHRGKPEDPLLGNAPIPEKFYPFTGSSFKLTDLASGIGSGMKGGCKSCSSPYKCIKNMGGGDFAHLLYKHKLIGKGWLSDFAHSLTSKTFNFLGEYGTAALIEIAVKILGEPFRKPITFLVNKYGVKAVKYIKKYAHKGIDYIKDKLTEKKGGSHSCSNCYDTVDDMIGRGFYPEPSKISKFGKGFKDDLGNAAIWFAKNVSTPIVRFILPGKFGALASKPIHDVDKLVGATSNYKYQDPFEDAQTPQDVEDTKDKTSTGSRKPVRENKIIKKIKKLEGKGKVKDTLKNIESKVPWSYVEEIIGDVFRTLPRYSLVPRRFLFDPEQESIWGNGANKKNWIVENQNPNYNVSRQHLVKNANKDYAQYEAGMNYKNLSGGKRVRIKTGGLVYEKPYGEPMDLDRTYEAVHG
jgi:hypothetical protein